MSAYMSILPPLFLLPCSHSDIVSPIYASKSIYLNGFEPKSYKVKKYTKPQINLNVIH